MQLLTEQEKKRIQRYCTYPKIAATALVMSFVACLLMLPLQMINDIAFHQKEFQPAGIYTAIALTAIELIIFCYCALAPRFGMQGKQWKELQSRLAVAQTNKDRSAEVAGVLAAQDALEPVCKRVAADDPYESYHDYGYRIIGYLGDIDLGAQAAVATFLSMQMSCSRTSITPVRSTPRQALHTTSPAASRISRHSAPPAQRVRHFRCHTGPPHAMQPVG
ncbi:hypothetical protein ACTNA2_02710 [Collinsella sp. HCP28S3_E9]|uniref:hypothetical protein n=1 Tax=unclassified Collinsella TaxID=2637548 RepID=UPI003F887F3C